MRSDYNATRFYQNVLYYVCTFPVAGKSAIKDKKGDRMNKGELVARIADMTKMTKKESEVMVNAFMDAVKEAMKKNDKVALVGFGTFGVKERKARKGVNPKTLKAITIPKKKAPFFKPGKALKDAIAKK
jgi:DNA-binding protein HU-beta